MFVVVSKPKIVLWISAYAAATVNPNGVNALLANGVSTFFINGKPEQVKLMLQEVCQELYLIALV